MMQATPLLAGRPRGAPTDWQPMLLDGARLLATPPFRDARGGFEEVWERTALAAAGIAFTPESAAHSYNTRAGTVRGMHFQLAPHGQAKVVSVVSGRALDVIVDLRPASPSYLRWSATELEAGSGQSLYIPAGYGHGFLTLAQHTTIAYLIEGPYLPAAAGLVRWNDPAIGIDWPIEDPILAERDRNAPDMQP